MKFKTEAIKTLPPNFRPAGPPDQDCRDLKGLRVELIHNGARGNVHHAVKQGEVIRCFVLLDSKCSGWFTLDDLDPA